jgi:hypothetical protein
MALRIQIGSVGTMQIGLIVALQELDFDAWHATAVVNRHPTGIRDTLRAVHPHGRLADPERGDDEAASSGAQF